MHRVDERRELKPQLKKLIKYILWCLVVQRIVPTARACRNTIQGSKLVCRKVQATPRTSIINTTSVTDSLMQCSSVCVQQRSCSLYYVEADRSCHCNHGVDNSSVSDDTDAMVYVEMVCLTQNPYQLDRNSYPRDCLELFKHGHIHDGIYVIHPVGGVRITTWCDMTNGGWTVFQRRQDGSENFLRNWTEYTKGFGNKCGEYWLGLDSINLLTTEPSELYIEMETFGDVNPTSAYASYSSFSVGNSDTNYKLSVGRFQGDCGDSLRTHNGMQFSTSDQDNDLIYFNCAKSFDGAWWYNQCHTSNLNGLYLKGPYSSYGNGISWFGCWGYYYSVKKTEMKTRRT